MGMINSALKVGFLFSLLLILNSYGGYSYYYARASEKTLSVGLVGTLRPLVMLSAVELGVGSLGKVKRFCDTSDELVVVLSTDLGEKTVAIDLMSAIDDVGYTVTSSETAF